MEEKPVTFTETEASQARLGLEERIEELVRLSPACDDQVANAFSAYIKLGGYFTLDFMRAIAARYK